MSGISASIRSFWIDAKIKYKKPLSFPQINTHKFYCWRCYFLTKRCILQKKISLNRSCDIPAFIIFLSLSSKKLFNVFSSSQYLINLHSLAF